MWFELKRPFNYFKLNLICIILLVLLLPSVTKMKLLFSLQYHHIFERNDDRKKQSNLLGILFDFTNEP